VPKVRLAVGKCRVELLLSDQLDVSRLLVSDLLLEFGLVSYLLAEFGAIDQELILESIQQDSEVVKHKQGVLCWHLAVFPWLHELLRELKLQRKHCFEALFDAQNHLVAFNLNFGERDPLELACKYLCWHLSRDQVSKSLHRKLKPSIRRNM
jgi:hypothetical protein